MKIWTIIKSLNNFKIYLAQLTELVYLNYSPCFNFFGCLSFLYDPQNTALSLAQILLQSDLFLIFLYNMCTKIAQKIKIEAKFSKCAEKIKLR